MVRKLNFQRLFVCALVVSELDLLNRFAGVGVGMGSGIMCLDLCAKWYVRDGEEFLDIRDNSEDEIEPEGFLHGKKIINLPTPSNEEDNDDMPPQANIGLVVGSDIEEIGGESRGERGREGTPSDVGGCPFSELIHDGTQVCAKFEK